MALAVQQLPVVDRWEDLTQSERMRATILCQDIRTSINARQDLSPDQKTSIINELAAQTLNSAYQRHFSKEPTNVVIRRIIADNKTADTLMDRVFQVAKSGAIGSALYHHPIPSALIMGTVYISGKCFEEECCLNKFFSWVTCSQKAVPAQPLEELIAESQAPIPPLRIPPKN